MRVTMQKNGVTGTPSAALKVSFQPKWATTDLKLKVTQTGENTVSVSYTPVKLADYHDFWIENEDGDSEGIYPDEAQNLSWGKYVLYGQAFKDGGCGKVYKLSFEVKPLWDKQPVLNSAAIDGSKLTLTYTYYGEPDAVEALVTYPDMGEARIVSLTVDADGGTKGVKVSQTFDLNGDGYHYADGTYTVALRVTKDGDYQNAKATKTVKAADKFMNAKIAIKSVTQVSETTATVTLKSKLPQLSDMSDRRILVTVGEAQYEFSADMTSLKIDVIPGEETSIIVEPVRIDDLDDDNWIETGAYTSGLYSAETKFTAKEGFWKLVKPTFTVEQLADTRVKVTMTKGNASLYEVVAFKGKTTKLEDVALASTIYDLDNDASCVLDVGIYDDVTVFVFPVFDGEEAKDMATYKSLTLIKTWDKLKKVTAKLYSKTDDIVNFGFSYTAQPDGVWVHAYEVWT